MLRRLLYSEVAAWLLLPWVLLALLALTGCTSTPTAPAPSAKVRLLFFTQDACAPCRLLKTQLLATAMADVIYQFELTEITYPDARFSEYGVSATPTLIALTSHGPETYPGGSLGQLRKWLFDVAGAQADSTGTSDVPVDLSSSVNMHPLPNLAGILGKISEGGPTSPDGRVAVVCDLPATERKKNIASKGLGCCLAADTPINVKDGSVVEIKDLDPKKHAICFLDENGLRRTTNLYEVRKTGRVRHLYELQIKDGRFIRVTGDHRIAYHDRWEKDSDSGFVSYQETWSLERYGSWKEMSFLTIPLKGTFRECIAELQSAFSLQKIEIPATDVWDIQVFEKCYKGEGNFFANGILVHNCVFRSIEYAARWQQVPELYDLPEQMVKAGIPGGGYPDKVKQILEKFGPNVKYIQDTSGDPAILEAILKSGRMPCVTYNGHDCHYSGSIAHMVCLPYFDRSTGWACVSDNNFPAETTFVWLSCDEFLQRWKGGGGSGWVVALLSPPPPPIPRN